MANAEPQFDVNNVPGGDAQRTPQALAYIANRLNGIEYQLTQQTELLREVVEAIKIAAQVRQ